MKELSFLSLCFVVILGQTGCAARLEFPNGNPTEPLNTPDSDLHFWEILVVHDEVELCEAPDGEDCSPVTGQWLKHYVVGDEVGEYLLLVSIGADRKINRFHGWAHKDNLLTTPHAMRNTNRACRQILAVNKWRRPKQGQEPNLEQVNAWNGLHAGRDIAKNLNLFEFFFIFLEQKDREGKRHYLIGRDPYIADFENGEECIVGWLSEDRALGWDTRQALYFNKSNFANRLADDNLGLIFRSKEDARAWYLGGKRPEKTAEGAPLVLESREVMSEPPFDWPRFPILEEPTRLSPDHDTRIFKIAFIGDTITSTGQVMPREAIWEERSKLRRLQDAETQVQILDEGYIVDSTPGRDRYRLNEGCMEKLERDWVDPSVMETLRSRAGDRVYSEEEFDRKVIGILSADERRFYESLIKDAANMDKLVETYVLVDHEALLAMYGLISRMVKRPIKRETVLKIWKREVLLEMGANMLAFGGESRSIADLIELHFGFPVKEGFLRMTPDELERLSGEELLALYERLSMKRYLLADIISEQAVAYQFEDGVFTGTVNRGRRHYFFSTMAGNTKYAWIKRKYLP